MKKIRLIIFAKAPITGFAKTRLIPALGERGAAQLAQKLLLRMLSHGETAVIGVVELCVTPELSHPLWKTLPISSTVELTEQGSGDLGMRLARASERAIDRGESVLLVGTDCPQLTPDILQFSAESLSSHDAVIIPASDGGYTLLGFNKYSALLFENILWSTDSVFSETRQRFEQLQWRVKIMAHLNDIDEPKDLQWLPDDWPERNFYHE